MKDCTFYNLKFACRHQSTKYRQEADNTIKREMVQGFTLSKLTTNIATGTGLSISFAG